MDSGQHRRRRGSGWLLVVEGKGQNLKGGGGSGGAQGGRSRGLLELEVEDD